MEIYLFNHVQKTFPMLDGDLVPSFAFPVIAHNIDFGITL